MSHHVKAPVSQVIFALWWHGNWVGVMLLHDVASFPLLKPQKVCYPLTRRGFAFLRPERLRVYFPFISWLDEGGMLTLQWERSVSSASNGSHARPVAQFSGARPIHQRFRRLL